MRWTIVLAATLLLGLTAAPATTAQAIQAGPSLTVLAHHAHPDDADPLGFPYPPESEVDYFNWRYRHLDADRDGFDFPSAVVDGVLLVEGLPDSSAPFVSTRDGYEAAFQQRVGLEPAVALQLGSQATEGQVSASLAVLPQGNLQGESLQVWMALTEDPVRYEPPPALSNGIFDHRFTVRAIASLGPLQDEAAGGDGQGAAAGNDTAQQYRFSHAFQLQDGWDTQRLHVVAWVQQSGQHGTGFDAHEVAQVTRDQVADDTITEQRDKGVLLDIYSATWCDPCLFGDTAAEELAVQYGAARPIDKAQSGTAYFQPPEAPLLVVFAVLAAAIWVGRRTWPGNGPRPGSRPGDRGGAQ